MSQYGIWELKITLTKIGHILLARFQLYYGLACTKAGDEPLQDLWESSILFRSTAYKTSYKYSMEVFVISSLKGLQMSFYGANLHVVYK